MDFIVDILTSVGYQLIDLYQILSNISFKTVENVGFIEGKEIYFLCKFCDSSRILVG